MLGNASPSTVITNSGTVGFTVSANMDSQPDTQVDLVNSQSNKGQLEDPKNITEAGKEVPRPPLELSPFPALLQAPTNCFSREEIVNEILDFTDQIASTALYGSIGVGKSFVALAVLHHSRTRATFGRNRHFMRCDGLTNSLGDFLERLSDAIGTSRMTGIGQLRSQLESWSQLESSPPRLLVLDGVDFVLDSPAPEVKEIATVIEGLGSDQRVCLVTTSRIYPDIQGFQRIEVPTLPEDGAREAFYSNCGLGRSPAVDDLIAELDFHPLSIDLLARSVRENDWDATTLLQAWADNQTSTLRANYLKEALEVSLRSQAVQDLGTTAQDTLIAIATFPLGIEEGKLWRISPQVEVAVDVLCRFSLIYRQDGFVKMLSPFRNHFLDSIVTPAQHEEVIRWGPDCSPAPARMSFLFHLFCDHRVTAFEAPPIFAVAYSRIQPPRTTKSATSLPNADRRQNPRPKRREHGNL